jgi:hypothetical protein
LKSKRPTKERKNISVGFKMNMLLHIETKKISLIMTWKKKKRKKKWMKMKNSSLKKRETEKLKNSNVSMMMFHLTDSEMQTLTI